MLKKYSVVPDSHQFIAATVTYKALRSNNNPAEKTIPILGVMPGFIYFHIAALSKFVLQSFFAQTGFLKKVLLYVILKCWKYKSIWVRLALFLFAAIVH